MAGMDAWDKLVAWCIKDPAAPPRARVWAAARLCAVKPASPAAIEILLVALGAPEDEVGRAARSALVPVLPRAPGVLPRVIEKLRDANPAARRNAAWALGCLQWNGDPPGETNRVLPALTAALEDPDASVRHEIKEAILRCSHWAEQAGPALVRLAADPDISVRKEALRALQHAGDRGPDAIHALAAGLHDEDPGARVEAALAFAYRSRTLDGDPAIQSIFMEALASSDAAARARALEGLWQVSWRDEFSLAVFVEHLKDPDPFVRATAALQIFNVGWNDPGIAKPAVPALVEALGRGEHHAARALVKIAPGEPALLAFLVDALRRDGEKHIAAALLLEIGAEVEAALGVLLDELRRPSIPWTFGGKTYYPASGRNDAAEALLEHTPASESLVAELRGFLDDPDPDFRTLVALAMARLDPADDTALAAIAAALKDPRHEVRQRTIAGLRHVVKRNERVVPLLIEALSDPLEEVRAWGCWLLSDLKSPPAGAVPQLAACLSGKKPMLRHRALDLLHRLGPEAREAEAVLVELLGDPDQDIRLRAAIVLIAVGAGRAAGPALEELARHPDERISAPAARALAALRGRARG
jgi:HEAT repeat protein